MNCLLGALLYKWRYGGKPLYRWPTLQSPWGHWFVFRDPYVIWYSSRINGISQDLNIIKQLWFKGHFRKVKER